MKKKPKKSNINGLNIKEFVKIRGSFFQLKNVPARTNEEKSHPAKFPEQLAEKFIKTYTRKGQIVLDPFGGIGSTGIAAQDMERKAILIEIGEKWYETALRRNRLNPDVKIFKADSSQFLKKIKKTTLRIDYTFTSPPYANVLHNTYNGTDRIKQGLDKTFTSKKEDFGNMGYNQFLDAMIDLTNDIYDITKNDRYCTFVVQNYLSKDFVDGKRKGKSYQHLLAWELGLRIREGTPWRVMPEAIWLQEKNLMSFGFPKYFYHSNHHHYLINLHKEL